MNCKEKLLEVRDLHKVYTKEGVPTKALNGITFNVLNGEYLGIMGASGSGKTTLLNCIATVIKPTAGQILLSGANISSFDGGKLAEYRGNKIGYLFQDFALLDNLTGRENILLPLSIHNMDISTAEKRLTDIAGFLGITDVLSKFPTQMSGGQKQRVAAARSLISNPDIILADEPTGALDTKAARLLMEKLLEINQKHIWFYLYNGYSGGELDPLFSGNFNLVPTFLKAQTGEFTIGRWVRTMLEGNLIIFLPMGFFLPFVSKTINTRNIFAFAVITPIAIELLQPVIGRSFDVDDVMMNFAGIIIGYFITLGIKATAAKR